MNTELEKQIENLPKKGKLSIVGFKLLTIKITCLRSTEFGVSTTENYSEEIIFDT